MFVAGIECCRGCLEQGILSEEWQYNPDKGWLCPKCKTGTASSVVKGISVETLKDKLDTTPEDGGA